MNLLILVCNLLYPMLEVTKIQNPKTIQAYLMLHKSSHIIMKKFCISSLSTIDSVIRKQELFVVIQRKISNL